MALLWLIFLLLLLLLLVDNIQWSQGSDFQIKANKTSALFTKDRLVYIRDVNSTAVSTILSCAQRCRLIESCKNLAFRGQRPLTECHVNVPQEKIEEGPFLDGINVTIAWHLQEILEPTYASCDALYKMGVRSSGIYSITGLGKHYCFLSDETTCGEGAWTLAVTVDTTKGNFLWASDVWIVETPYMAEKGIEEPLNLEAKYPAFSKMAFSSLCLGMEKSGLRKWGLVYQSQKRDSLYAVFTAGIAINTVMPKSTWLALVSGFVLQNNCNRQGFMASCAGRRSRIGILSNEQNDCNSCDTAVGVGLNSRACGNEGSGQLPSRCFILIRT